MAETIGPSRRTFQRAETDQAQFLKRWLSVWVALLTVVVVVVVVFLLKITDSLSSIDDGLAEADTGVTGAGGDVGSLPDQVANINESLNAIDPALKNVPDQTVAILQALQSINGKLVTTDGSLKDTGGNLRAVVGQATDISNLLINADDPSDGLGVQNIHQRVAFANGVGNTGRFGSNPNNLTVAEAQAGNILAGLVDTNRHLVGICNSTAVSALNGGARC
jgi:ABC-type transporter Mla subunit MlaD